MRVLLIAPPFYRLFGSHHNGINLGLSYVGASLKEQGHTVALYNADYLAQEKYLDQAEIFSSFDTYKEALNNHDCWGEVAETMYDFKPDVVGITMYTGAYRSARNVAYIAKRCNEDVRILVGGPHPTLAWHEMIELPWIDTIVSGEGEGITLGNKLSTKGHEFRQVEHKDIDAIPFPLRDSFLNDTEYMDLGNIITARGCPNACTFCASPAIWGRRVRYRNIDNVVEEIELLEKMQVSPIRFVDDAFNLDIDRTVELVKRLPPVEWVCEARVDRLTEGLLDLMALSGCRRIKIGVESGSDKILKHVRKGMTVMDVRRGVELIQQSGIPFTAYLMCGFPDETDEDIEQTIELAKWMKADYYSVSVFTPYYGTQVWKEMEEQGRLPVDKNWEYHFHQSQQMVINDGLSKERMKELLALNGKGRSRA